MNDRELLEAAAKAAGIDLPNTLSNWLTYDQKCGFQWWNMDGSKTEKTFNPLNDDGDAFRLAVKLGMHTGLQSVSVWRNGQEELHIFQDGDDPFAATRRAIVRAAAEMGKIPATL